MSELYKIVTIWIIASFLLLIGCKASETVKNNPFENNSVVAHRGAWKDYNLPENSIASLRKAIELKCAGSEFDVRMTLDDSLIVFHDTTLGNLNIEKTKYEVLSKFKLSNGEKIPSLREYLRAGIKNNQSTRLFCEIKPSKISNERGIYISNRVFQLVNEINAQPFVTYISFNYNILKNIRKLDSAAATLYLEGDKSPRQLVDDRISGMDYPVSRFQKHPEWIEEAKQNKLILNAWTVNDSNAMDWLLTHKFDYITTDMPGLLLDKVNRISKKNEEYQLVWSDEFEYNGLPDSTKWNYEVGGNGWGNNEKQFYSSKLLENANVNNGKLHIVALEKEFENSKYTSARLTTYQRFSLQYGRVEVMAKIPQGKGTWPAIWMLPESLRLGIEKWPLCGEIDIMEHVGKDQNVVHTSLHTELYNFWKQSQYTHFEKLDDVSNAFHLYSIDWTPESIKFFIDNRLFYEAIKGENGKDSTNLGWPFDKKYFLILNLAIGGNWGGEIDNSIFPVEMQIDYVRMFQKH